MMKEKPRLSFWQIWNMSFGFFGIQFGFALQNANVSRIFETLGASIDDIPILWVAAPITGLLVQPIVGYFSDRTWTKLGRRRPFFLAGALLASIALIIMPNSWELWVAAGMLWIMDASINISMEPFRAFVGDLLPDEQRTAGFAMQSFFIGTGAVIASALPYMLTNWAGISNTAAAGVIPDSVKWSFYLGAGVFFLSVLYTVITSKEYSPEEMEAFEKARKEYSPEELRKALSAERKEHKLGTLGTIWMLAGLLLTALFRYLDLERDLYILSGGIAFFGLIQLMASAFRRSGRENSGFVTVMEDLYNMPRTMRQLAVVQFFSWFALFAMWIYSTAGITGQAYDMHLSRDEVQALHEVYREISRKGSRDAGIEAEFERYEKKFEAGKTPRIDSRFVNYFLDGRLISEEKLLDDLDKLSEHLPQDESGKAAKEEVRSLRAEMAGAGEGRGSGPESVSYETLHAFILSHPGTLQMAGEEWERLLLVDRLKYVQKEYNTGANWVGILFAAYNLFAAMIAFFLPFMARYIGRKGVHALCLGLGGLGLIAIFFIHAPGLLLLPMLGVGIAWAGILSMPYAILSGALPAKKMGLYMGIFNFFIVIPQIVAASLLGFFMRNLLGNDAVMALVLGGGSMLLAAVLVFFVDDVAEQKS